MNKLKGFTLVELSIVLVIIGLLIGGILAAQSMIGTTKVQALTRQISQFDTAVTNFQTKYNQLPGDTNLMGSTPGDNDGYITQKDNNNYFFAQEVGKFWADLSNSGFINGNGGKYIEATGGPIGITQAPRIKGEVNAIAVGIGSPIAKHNYYVFFHPTRADNIMGSLEGAFKIADIQAIDSKIDDGIDNSGNVNGTKPDVFIFDSSGSYDYLVHTNTGDTCVAGGGGTIGPYDVSSARLCGILVRMGTTNGDLK